MHALLTLRNISSLRVGSWATDDAGSVGSAIRSERSKREESDCKYAGMLGTRSKYGRAIIFKVQVSNGFKCIIVQYIPSRAARRSSPSRELSHSAPRPTLKTSSPSYPRARLFPFFPPTSAVVDESSSPVFCDSKLEIAGRILFIILPDISGSAGGRHEPSNEGTSFTNGRRSSLWKDEWVHKHNWIWAPYIDIGCSRW